MSEDTTTIEIAKWQREELEARKNYDGEAVKKVIGRLLKDSQPANKAPDRTEVREIAREEINSNVNPKALE